MKINKNISIYMIIGVFCFTTSCQDFVEIDAPNQKIVNEDVFENEEMAISVMRGIYNQLFRSYFCYGGMDSVTVLAGLSSDNIRCIKSTNMSLLEFEKNELNPNNPRNLNLWNSAYNVIYMTNTLLEGLLNSENISAEVLVRLEGEAKFIRAFSYFYLVNLYGDVPLILSTDYRTNSVAEQNTIEEIYDLIESDLNFAITSLNEEYIDNQRIYVNSDVATALLARVYLFQEKWEKAEQLSSQLISQSSKYKLLEDFDEVFLANSLEAIWQISPIGRGNGITNTMEGEVFLVSPFLSSLAQLKLSEELVNSFDSNDKRLSKWIGYHTKLAVYYPFKYKIRYSQDEITEYSMVLRLSEQYLIRAEARAKQDKLSLAIEDVNMIRQRAGLNSISTINLNMSKSELLQVILKEKRKELFGEWGHRWLDLKRTKTADAILGDYKEFWENTDTRYPIPENERLKNPNLGQNDGY